MVVQYGGQQQRRCDAAKSGAPVSMSPANWRYKCRGRGEEEYPSSRYSCSYYPQFPLLPNKSALRAVVFQFIFPRHGGAAGFETRVHKPPFALRGLCAAAIIMRGCVFPNPWSAYKDLTARHRSFSADRHSRIWYREAFSIPYFARSRTA